jgi:hypothetical protein
MDTPYLPLSLRHGTIGPFGARQPQPATGWTEFAARLRAHTEVDVACNPARRPTVTARFQPGDAVLIAERMLAAIGNRRH